MNINPFSKKKYLEECQLNQEWNWSEPSIPISKIEELIEKQPAAPNLRSWKETIEVYLKLKNDLQKLIDKNKP